MRYMVDEIFRTFQGEGQFTGWPAVFIRLHGCNQKCHWCDSAATWHPKFNDGSVTTSPPIGAMLSSVDIAARVEQKIKEVDGHVGDIVVTGGEPALWSLSPLIEALAGRLHLTPSWELPSVHIETAGHVAQRFTEAADSHVWLTVSPKHFATHPVPEMIHRANEYKIVVEEPWDIPLAVDTLATEKRERPEGPCYLVPEWSKRNDPAVLDAIARTASGDIGWIIDVGLMKNVKDVELQFKAGMQTHKYFRVDQLDPDSDQRNIPIGGEGAVSSRLK